MELGKEIFIILFYKLCVCLFWCKIYEPNIIHTNLHINLNAEHFVHENYLNFIVILCTWKIDYSSRSDIFSRIMARVRKVRKRISISLEVHLNDLFYAKNSKQCTFTPIFSFYSSALLPSIISQCQFILFLLLFEVHIKYSRSLF